MQAVEKGVLECSQLFFHTPSLLAKSLLYHLICTGEFICKDDYHVKRESYNSFLIMYIKKGRGTLCYDNKSLQLKENDLVFINCYKSHEYFTNTGWETTWIHFDGNNANDFFETIQNQCGFVISLQSSLVVQKLLDIILEGFKSSNPLPEPMISYYIHRMLSEILLLKNSSPTFKENTNPFISKSILYIENNFRKKLSINDIATHIQMSAFYFSRQFKKETGYSPYEYVIKTRIDHAKVLLKNTSLYIKEIAFDSGFLSEPNFIFTFQKNVGMTPGQFRNIQF